MQVRCKLDFNTQLRGCKLNIRKKHKDADSEPYKISDTNKLNSQAAIIIALMKKQPQELKELCRSAGINDSTFYRNKRLLINRGIIKTTRKGYALWNFKERTTLWDRLKSRLEQHGGYLLNLEVDRFSALSDIKDPRTSWPQKIFNKKDSITGIIILRNAEELQSIASIHVPISYEAALLTPDSLKNNDRVWWKSTPFDVVNTREVFDGYNLSYRIAYLYNFKSLNSRSS